MKPQPQLDTQDDDVIDQFIALLQEKQIEDKATGRDHRVIAHPRSPFVYVDFWAMTLALLSALAITSSFIRAEWFEQLYYVNISATLVALVANLTRDRVQVITHKYFVNNVIVGPKPEPSRLQILQRKHGVKIVGEKP